MITTEKEELKIKDFLKGKFSSVVRVQILKRHSLKIEQNSKI